MKNYESYKITCIGKMPARRETLKGALNLKEKLKKAGKRSVEVYGVYIDEKNSTLGFDRIA